MKIYFDNILINDDYYTQLSQDRILFNEGDTFSLGSTICAKIKLGIDKRIITSHPSNVRIEIDNKVYGNYIVDNIEENDYEYVYNLTDKMVNFNFNYSAKELIENSKKIENDIKYVYLSEILEDMCSKANVELATTTFLGSTKHVSWYDNRITAREYLSYIAELNGGYAIINKNGKLELRQYTNLVKQTISTEECDNFKLGLEHKIQRVVFDFNTDKWEKGTGETLYINPNNVFITSQEDVNNIYEIVNNLKFYTFKVNYSPIYDVETGECIEFKIGTKKYPTFAQYSLNYNGGWIGGYKFDVASSKQQETTIKDSTKQDIKSIRTELDRTNAELKIIAEKTVDITNNASGIGTLNITNGSKGILHKLDIYGTLELPIVGNIIVGQFNVNIFKIIIKQGDNTKEYIVDDMKNLYQIGTTHDTFEYLDGKCSITRRIGLNNDGTKYILDTPYVEQLKDLNIEVPDGDYTITANHNNLHLDAEYLTKNEYTDAFAKQVDVSSMIKVASDEVLIQSKREILDNGDELIASINTKSTGDVLINASKTINFEGKEFNVSTEKMKITIGLGEEKKDLINANGVLTNLIYTGYIDGSMFVGSGDYIPLGRVGGGETADTQRNKCTFAFKLPENYVVQSAKIYLSHAPTIFTYGENQSITGYSRNLKLYKGNPTNLKMHFNMNSSMSYTEGASFSEIYNAFGSDGFTGNASNTTNIQSIDIKDYIDTDKENFLSIYDGNYTTYTTNEDIFSNTGSVFAYLEIIGYSQI